MAARKTRVNFTLSPDNVRAAQEICEERGLKLSTFVDRAIAAYAKQLREPAAPPSLNSYRRPPSARESIDMGIEQYFDSPIGREYLERVITERLEAKLKGREEERLEAEILEEFDSLPAQCETPPPGTATPAAPPAGARTSTPKASTRTQTGGRQSTVDVSPDVLERLRKFPVPQLVEATGMDRTNVSRIRSGNRARLQQATYDRLMAGLEQLESQS